jgi:hypothetical protein
VFCTCCNGIHPVLFFSTSQTLYSASSLSLSWELCNLPVVGCEVWHSGRKQQAMQTVEVVYYECEWGLRPLASDRNGRPSASSSHE